MKGNCCQAVVAFLLLALSVACEQEKMPEPQLSAAATREVVKGKWSIRKVDYQLCRSGQCHNSSLSGMSADFFEFRADSAFLLRVTESEATQRQAFKAYYNLPGAFMLSNEHWSGKFELKGSRANELVLENTYTGSDPYATFRDTYYLYR